MQLLKQFFYEKRATFTLLMMVYFLYKTINIIKVFFDGTATGFDIVLSFFLVFFTLLGFCFAFMFSLTPYKRVIVKERLMEDDTFELPKLYSFSENNEFSVKIQKNDKNINELLENEKPLSMIDLKRIKIQLLTEDDNEIPVRISPYRSGYYGIEIHLENKSDLKIVKKIKIKSEKPINALIEHMSYNGK